MDDAQTEMLRALFINVTPATYDKAVLDKLYTLGLISVSRNGIHVTREGRDALRDAIIKQPVRVNHGKRRERTDHR